MIINNNKTKKNGNKKKVNGVFPKNLFYKL